MDRLQGQFVWLTLPNLQFWILARGMSRKKYSGRFFAVTKRKFHGPAPAEGRLSGNSKLEWQKLLDAGSVAQVQTGGVAYLAHVGGFVFGVVTGRLWVRKDGLGIGDWGLGIGD